MLSPHMIPNWDPGAEVLSGSWRSLEVTRTHSDYKPILRWMEGSSLLALGSNLTLNTSSPLNSTVQCVASNPFENITTIIDIIIIGTNPQYRHRKLHTVNPPNTAYLIQLLTMTTTLDMMLLSWCCCRDVVVGMLLMLYNNYSIHLLLFKNRKKE